MYTSLHFFLPSCIVVYVYDPARLRNLLRIDNIDKVGLERRPADQEAIHVRQGRCVTPARQPARPPQRNSTRDTH